jgi:Protein of unknown function DUF262
MKRHVENWPLERVHKERTFISFPEYQREKMLWSTDKKSLLIDTILEDIDIPKLYFNRTGKGRYEVVDGQQRLWTIWEFLTDEFRYKGKTFSSLNAAQRAAIKAYELQITVFEDADDAYLKKLFVRLQIALLLVAGEKLHALSGAMKEFIFGPMVRDRFIAEVGIASRRYAKQTLCAQICINSFSRGRLGPDAFTSTRFENLQYFFEEFARPQGKDKQLFDDATATILRVLGALWKAFGERTHQLNNRSYLLSLYFCFEALLGTATELPKKEAEQFVDFALRLWRRSKEEAKRGFERTNKELYTFGTYLSSAPTEKYQIQRRDQKLREYYEYFKKHNGKIKGD